MYVPYESFVVITSPGILWDPVCYRGIQKGVALMLLHGLRKNGPAGNLPWPMGQCGVLGMPRNQRDIQSRINYLDMFGEGSQIFGRSLNLSRNSGLKPSFWVWNQFWSWSPRLGFAEHLLFPRFLSAMYFSRKCFADWHRSRFGAQVARIERQLARSPENVEVRSRLLLAYSKELARCNRTTLKGTAPLAPCSDFLELVHLHGMEFLKASLEASTAKRIQSVMDTLLDLKDFQLYPLIARFAVTLARHEESLSEFDWKGELQERATMFHYETALQLLKSVKCLEEAQVLEQQRCRFYSDQHVLRCFRHLGKVSPANKSTS